MCRSLFCLLTVWTGLIFGSSPAPAAETPSNDDAIKVLRLEIEQLRSDYEQRIADLERRLDAAERGAADAAVPEPDAAVAATPAITGYPPPAVTQSPQSVSVARDSSFNPAIGVTFQGQAWSYRRDPEDYAIPGFPLGGEAGLAPEGLSLAETEITMSANVDDKFTAMLTLPIVIEEGETAAEIEEAWIEALALPAGLSLRMGRVFSNIGYLNTRHFHSWDFGDQPLAYQAFLGNQYLDDGLQLRWLAPTDLYLEFGAEVLRGDRYPAGGAANSGIGATTLSLRTGGDVGFSHSWLVGLSWLGAESEERESGDEDAPLLFTGDTDLYVADFVWKWAPDGNSRERNFKLQAEYLWRNEDGAYLLAEDLAAPWDENQRGWYVQGIFQPFPRWRFGARIDSLSGGTRDPGFAGSPLFPLGSNPMRYSLMADWSNSEFSRLRLQYNRDEAVELDDDQFGLQYIFSIGAHGAHSF
jgi:hypothetical protein